MLLHIVFFSLPKLQSVDRQEQVQAPKLKRIVRNLVIGKLKLGLKLESVIKQSKALFFVLLSNLQLRTKKLLARLELLAVQIYHLHLMTIRVLWKEATEVFQPTADFRYLDQTNWQKPIQLLENRLIK